MKEYVEIIRGLREDNDLKQTEIASVLGTAQQYYSKYEKGEHELPIRALVLLADYYGVSADYLLGRTRCKHGVEGLDKMIDAERTAGEVISDMLSLSTENRAKVIEYLYLQKMKETMRKKNGEKWRASST